MMGRARAVLGRARTRTLCLALTPCLRVVSLKRTLAAACLALCLMLAVSRRPFSLPFPLLHSKDALKTEAADLNSQRTEAALEFFRLLPRKTPEELRAMSRPDDASYRFTIALITVGRKRPPNSQQDVGYVLQSAASVLSMVRSKPAFRNSFVFVCNVDEHPANHADAVRLQEFLPYAERYGSSTVPNVSDLPIPGTEKLYRDTRHASMFDRELHDYNFCLQVAHGYASQYYLILQDDAVPCPEFSEVLEHTLSKVTKPQTCLSSSSSSSSSFSSTFRNSFSNSSSSSSSSSSSWLRYFLPSNEASCMSDLPPYSSGLAQTLLGQQRTISPSPNSSFAFIKFYFPERWQGFAFEPLRLLDLLSVGAVGGGLGWVVHAVWTGWRRKKQQQLLSPPGWRAFLAGVGVSLLVASVVGRQNLNELRRISKHAYRFQPSPRCCIPAMLYPAPVMPFLVAWLAESPEYRADRPDESLVDLRIDDCFRHYQVPGYYVEPNIVRHVGMLSTLPKRNKKPVEEFLLSC